MKKYGYVIEIRKTNKNYPMYYSGGVTYKRPLKFARVHSRTEAYGLRYKGETVRKVELFKNGNPKKVVKS